MRTRDVLLVLITTVSTACQTSRVDKNSSSLTMPPSQPVTCDDTGEIPDAEWPNDPDVDSNWVLKQDTEINIQEAWKIQRDCRSVLIAVIDSGVDYNHPDLKENICKVSGKVQGRDFVTDTDDPMDTHYHGTHVAGTIGAGTDNGIGTAGICWKSYIVPMKFISSDGYGTASDAVEAILYSISIGAKIMNNSWGSIGYSPLIQSAVDLAEEAGVLFVAAAGNSGMDTDEYPFYPAALPNVNIISVAAIDSEGVRPLFSNFGKSTVQISAPGVNILSTLPMEATEQMKSRGMRAEYGFLSGTSMASPHVSASAALLWSNQTKLSALEIKAVLLNNCTENSRRLSKEIIDTETRSMDLNRALRSIASTDAAKDEDQNE